MENSKIKKISDKVWKLDCGSNLYLLELDEIVVIDTGIRSCGDSIQTFLSKVCPLDKVKHVIFTHLHYDHVGNFDRFSGARFYASKEAMMDFKRDPAGTVLKEDIAEKLGNIELSPAEDLLGLKIISTPGHTRGSICIWYEEERILFSGDTMLGGGLGRTDLPTSVPEEMQPTVMRLLKLNHKILCPGHDY